MKRRTALELARIAALCGVVLAVWFWVYKQSPLDLLARPAVYAPGDDTFVYAIVKAVSQGEIGLFGSKQVRRLGAPFVANWNDYPWTEDFLHWVPGLIARVTGVTPALNLAYIGAFLLAACSFYGVGRYMRWRWQWCFAGAVLFSWSYYITHRSITHYTLIFYGSAPLWLLMCWWTASRRGIPLWTGRFWFSAAAVVLTAWNSAYYTALLLQLLALAIITRLVRRYPWRGFTGPVLLGALCVALVASMHLDTLMYQRQHGPNPAATIRYMSEVELYSLRIVDLFLPFYHRWQPLEAIARGYAHRSMLSGELFATYLGFFGCVSLLWLFGRLAFDAMQAGRRRFSGLSLHALWLTAYGTVGGLNMIPAIFGFYLFRSMNRVSILLLLLALLHAVQQLSRTTRRWPAWAAATAAAVVVAIGLWDQTPVHTREHQDFQAARMTVDRRLGKLLEKRLGSGAMVFQLPVMRFPDSHPYHEMAGYDHLRPYIFSKTVRFSHGDNSGRATEEWRELVAWLPVAEQARQLALHGFSAVLIDCDGYADGAADLLQRYRELGYRTLRPANAGPFALVRLEPSAVPRAPVLPPHFTHGWYARERSEGDEWRWSAGRSLVEFHRPPGEVAVSEVAFDLHTRHPRTVRMTQSGQTIGEVVLDSDADREQYAFKIDWSVAPNPYVVEFTSDQPPWVPDEDRRPISFRIINVSQNPPVFAPAAEQGSE